MAARGVPPVTVTGWYRDRARTGHPEKAGRIGRTDYWYEDEWTAWHRAYQQGKLDSLTQVDRGGDPDDLVDAAEAARMLRYSSRPACSATPAGMSFMPTAGSGTSPSPTPTARPAGAVALAAGRFQELASLVR
jgi:hypothetical protein